MNGVHEGATFNVAEKISIGNLFENDMILTDDGIEETHVILEPKETQFGFGIYIQCRGEKIYINADHVLTKDQTLLMENSFVITLGGISLNIQVNSAGLWKTTYSKFLEPQINVAQTYQKEIIKTLSPDNILSDKRHLVITIMGVILFICMVVFIVMLIPESKPMMIRKIDVKTLQLRDEVARKKLVQQALSDLNRVITHYKLNGRVTTSFKEKTLYVSGRINNYENNMWIKVQNWYDSTYDKKVNLVSLITVHNGLRRTISFKAVVTTGHMPYVVSWRALPSWCHFTGRMDY